MAGWARGGEGRMEFLLTLRRRGIGDAAVLRALEEVPRERFVDHEQTEAAYADQALPIACGQTISQPYVVAYMTEQLGVRPHHRHRGGRKRAASLARPARRGRGDGAAARAARRIATDYQAYQVGNGNPS